MTSSRHIRWIGWLAVPAVFVALLLVLGAVNGEQSSEELANAEEVARAELPEAATEGRTGELIAAQRQTLAEDPAKPDALAGLGDAYYQRGRETSDGDFATLATDAYEAALELDPANITALVGRAQMKLIAHDFSGGLDAAREAHAAAPDLVATYLPLIDGLIETGDYAGARRQIEELFDLKPSLPAYARASYFAELEGNRADALRAMRLAADVGAPGTEARAFAENLIGRLLFDGGSYEQAAAAFERALDNVPGYVPARAGLLDVAALRGEEKEAIAGYRELVDDEERVEYADELGRLEQASGTPKSRWAAHYGLLSELHQRELEAGNSPDAGQVLFEADHGDPELGVELGERVWGSAPSVSSADA